MRQIKFKYHFTNHAPVILTLNDIEYGETLQNLLGRGGAGSIKARRQFIGKTDKNGKEIYEGDIMQGPFATGSGGTSTKYKDFYFEVFFYDTGFRIKVPKNYGAYRFHPRLEECSVVGNIYETPNLLIANAKS